MLDSLFSLVAPHYCCHCGEIGRPLCENCKYDITQEDFARCFFCGENAVLNGSCAACRSPYTRQWCVGERSGALERLIDNYKFHNVRSVHTVLAEMLDDRLPVLPNETIVVPIPTVAAHIRQRGYDHAALIAKSFARRRGLAFSKPLHRRTASTQRGATREQRSVQAKTAFCVKGELRSNVPYLLLDDVVTTGATLKYAARVMKEAGAKEIFVAAVAKQPLD